LRRSFGRFSLVASTRRTLTTFCRTCFSESSEVEGLTVREAAAKVGISVSGMKSRVQRGRAQLRALFEECCQITFVMASSRIRDQMSTDPA
jgi:hypothetical protein